jgi:hypothetical protein
MKHFEAIKLIGKRVEDLRAEIIKLELMADDKRNYSGYVFYKVDIENMLEEIEGLHITLKSLLK